MKTIARIKYIHKLTYIHTLILRTNYVEFTIDFVHKQNNKNNIAIETNSKPSNKNKL